MFFGPLPPVFALSLYNQVSRHIYPSIFYLLTVLLLIISFYQATAQTLVRSVLGLVWELVARSMTVFLMFGVGNTVQKHTFLVDISVKGVAWHTCVTLALGNVFKINSETQKCAYYFFE